MPLFVLGFPRSGTTALAQAISCSASYQDYGPEGHLMYLFRSGLTQVFENHLNSNCVLNGDYNRMRFLAMFRRALSEPFYPDLEGDRVDFIDKTPDLQQVLTVPVLSQLFPTAKFIYLYRQPVEAVRSNLATWPEVLEGKSSSVTKRWVECMKAWRAVRCKIPQDNFLEIFQPEMRENPSAVMLEVAELLSLDNADRGRVFNFLVGNKQVNRPRVGTRAKEYERAVLSKKNIEKINKMSAAEVDFWRRLRTI